MFNRRGSTSSQQGIAIADTESLLEPLPAAQAIELTKIYGTGDAAVRALDGVDVEFERARFTAVMGPSGSGKSTLMHCMAGLDEPTSGQAFVGEQELGRLDDAALTELRRDRIGFVFQSFNLVPTLTAAENITLPADLAGNEGRPGVVRLARGEAPARRPAVAPPERAVGRPAAAGRVRAGADRPARADLRRRADRQPRLQRLGRGAGFPAQCGRRARAVDRDGHPRPARRPSTPTGSCSWPTAGSWASCCADRRLACSSR